MQRLLQAAVWDPDAVRYDTRADVVEHLHDLHHGAAGIARTRGRR
ncbi:hypothetical protein [Catellatospora citrea]|nr:hypothetical protein [Catellatospora citrea]